MLLIYEDLKGFVDEKVYGRFLDYEYLDKHRIPLISDKLKPLFNWKTSEIWANYKYLKKLYSIKKYF